MQHPVHQQMLSDQPSEYILNRIPSHFHAPLPAFARPLPFVTRTTAVASLLPHTSTRVIFPGCESGLSSPPETTDSDYRVLPVTWLLAASLISFSTTQPFEHPLLSLENGEHIPISGALPLVPPQLGMLLPSRLAWLTPSPCSGFSSKSRGAFSSLTHLKQLLLPFSVPLCYFIFSYSTHDLIALYALVYLGFLATSLTKVWAPRGVFSILYARHLLSA